MQPQPGVEAVRRLRLAREALRPRTRLSVRKGQGARGRMRQWQWQCLHVYIWSGAGRPRTFSTSARVNRVRATTHIRKVRKGSGALRTGAAS